MLLQLGLNINREDRRKVTFSNIVSLESRLMRLRKLYEIGGAYRATILAQMIQQDKPTFPNREEGPKKGAGEGEIMTA